MRAVNLIPKDSARRGRSLSLGGRSVPVGRLGLTHAVIGVLVVALAFVIIYVLESNTVSQRQAQLTTLHEQVADVRVEAARLSDYVKFEQLAQARAATVREIAATRFDWHAALSDLAKVMPANAALQSLVATVSPSISAAGSSSASGSVRGDIDAPAFELKGCTGSQDEVAQLISRLRLINGVTRVTLEDSTAASSSSTSSSSSTGSSSSTSSGKCGSGPTFDLVVFFQPVPGAATNSGSSS